MKKLTLRFDSPETDDLIEQLKTEGVEIETKIEVDDFDGESDMIAIYVEQNKYEIAFEILNVFEQADDEAAE